MGQEERFSDLMRLAQAGDRQAYATLLTELTQVLNRFVDSKLGFTNSAQEVVQETLLSIHKARHTYDPARPFLPWAYAIARHRVVDHVRQWARTKSKEVESDYLDDSLAYSTQSAGGEEREVSDLLAVLNARQRHVVELLKIQGHSVRDVASRTGMSESAVKVMAHRAYKKIRTSLMMEANEYA